MQNVLDSITIEDFKALFPRGFNYLPVWDATKQYYTGDKIYYDITKSFYLAIVDNINTDPTDSTVWQSVKDDINLYVTDADLTKALEMAKGYINVSLIPKEALFKTAFLYLMAHFVYEDFNIFSSGLDSFSSGSGLVNSVSVGSVSESYTISTWMQNPNFLWLTKSPYGYKYLQIIYPYLFASSFMRFDSPTR